jgi:hypothetical protein
MGKDKVWADMTATERGAVNALGWSAATWDEVRGCPCLPACQPEGRAKVKAGYEEITA